MAGYDVCGHRQWRRGIVGCVESRPERLQGLAPRAHAAALAATSSVSIAGAICSTQGCTTSQPCGRGDLWSFSTNLGVRKAGQVRQLDPDGFIASVFPTTVRPLQRQRGTFPGEADSGLSPEERASTGSSRSCASHRGDKTRSVSIWRRPVAMLGFL